jgi:hypothetical protein
MRQLFFYVMGGLVVVSLASWALYMLGRAIAQVFGDWRLGRELDELEAQGALRRQQRQHSQEQRLATGCEHNFEAGAIGLPPNVCAKCGLERVKPSGACDHVWRVQAGPVPASQCERCGKIYHPLRPEPDLPRRS